MAVLLLRTLPYLTSLFSSAAVVADTSLSSSSERLSHAFPTTLLLPALCGKELFTIRDDGRA